MPKNGKPRKNRQSLTKAQPSKTEPGRNRKSVSKTTTSTEIKAVINKKTFKKQKSRTRWPHRQIL